MSDFSNSTTPVARHPHRCEYCFETIPKGEKHQKFSGVFEGEFQNWRMHNECYDAWAASGEEYFHPGSNERPIKINYGLLRQSPWECYDAWAASGEEYFQAPWVQS